MSGFIDLYHHGTIPKLLEKHFIQVEWVDGENMQWIQLDIHLVLLFNYSVLKTFCWILFSEYRSNVLEMEILEVIMIGCGHKL